MLNQLKKELQPTVTENGACAYFTTGSDCLDLFSTAGALRQAEDQEIIKRFDRAWAEDPSLALRIAFYARDVRGGMGERRFFRIILRHLADTAPESVEKNIAEICEYGRFDDLLVLLGTPCQKAMSKYLMCVLKEDMHSLDTPDAPVSLLGKWLPSVNASSPETVKRAKKLARLFKMSEKEYRQTLSRLRARIAILENYLRACDYTFDYQKQPSGAMLKYRKAFLRNDTDRYTSFLESVEKGEATLNAGTLFPYEVIAPILNNRSLDPGQRASLNATWSALPDYTDGRNALAVVDGSGSMYRSVSPNPAAVALSLGVYFAERTKGAFHNHFITFSGRPQLIELKGRDLFEKIRYCETFDEVANTNIERVFELILRTAVKNRLPQEELPETLFIISDMEFDQGTADAGVTQFKRAKERYRANGYRLPAVVFWNVASRRLQEPVSQNEQGAVLISGCSPQLFKTALSKNPTPYGVMLEILSQERYARLSA